MNQQHPTPILTSVYNICGILTGILTVVALTQVSTSTSRLVVAGVGISIAVMYLGIAQVVDFLGRTAHATERLCEVLAAGPIQEAGRSGITKDPVDSADAIPLQPYEDPFEKWQREEKERRDNQPPKA